MLVKGAAGGRLFMKNTSYPYRDIRYKYKTVSRQSYPYIRKTVFVLRQGIDFYLSCDKMFCYKIEDMAKCRTCLFVSWNYHIGLKIEWRLSNRATKPVKFQCDVATLTPCRGPLLFVRFCDKKS